jgi:drug/metabolite transporter (DMT)-like permease
MPTDHRTRTLAFTIAALMAFAANSILCRVALRERAVDPATFSAVRFVSGALTLMLLSRLSVASAFPESWRRGASGSWKSAWILLLYAIPFSFAYVQLTAGTGALILFGSVQVTMLLAALRSGHRPHPVQWFGLALALGGLIYLVLPGLTAPPLASSGLMAVAGFAWGMYSLRGRHASNPLLETTGNFVRTAPLVLAAMLVSLPLLHVEQKGVALAVASGALASGMGYVVWYTALPGLTPLVAAVVQLAVPVLAAAGGIVFLSEAISIRLVLSAIMVLGGIGLSIAGKERVSRRPEVSAA